MDSKRYEVAFKPGAKKQLEKLPTGIRIQIFEKIKALQDQPRPAGVKKLEGGDSFYRISVGDYRVIYSIEGDKLLVLILRIANRREVYRALNRLLK